MRKIKKMIKNLLSIPTKIFTKISIFSIIFDSKISKKSAVVSGCRIYNSSIDKYSYIGRNSIVINAKIGKFTSIANDCNIGLATHNINYLSTSPVFYKGKNCLKKNFSNIENEDYKKTIIGNDVWIGANVLIKGGISIGDGAVIGAGSIVTKDIPPYAIYAGNPAKLIRYRYDQNDINKLLDKKWWEYDEKKLYNINTKTNDINIILKDLDKNKILIQSIYAAPYRVGVFEQMSLTNDVEVFFEQLDGHNRNKAFFQNENNLKAYNLGLKKDLMIYKDKIKNIKQFDCVFVYDYSSFSSVKLMIKCILNKVPYCVNCDGYLLPEKKGFLFFVKKIIKSFFIKKAERLLANGESAKKYFLMHGAKEKNIDVHYFSTLYKKEIQKEICNQKKELKKELGLSNERLYVSVGSFYYVKGFDLIIEAANKLKDHTTQYVLIGGGPLLEEYKKTCIKYNLNNFKFIEFLKKDELLKYYDAADAFILATRGDVWGLVINEAMARGLPIISTNKCNAALEMSNEENGIIINSDSVLELSQAIKKFNQLNVNDLQLMGKKSLRISKKYNIEDIAECHNETIRKVIKK